MSDSTNELKGGANIHKEIVDRLNSPPFKKGYSLVVFDEICGNDLLDLFNSVLTTLDPNYTVDLKTEQKDIAVTRMMEFLKLLKFRMQGMSEEDWKNGLLNGEKPSIYPALRYVLINFIMLQKRAYLGRFIQKIEVPSEYATDANIQQLQQENEDLRRQFVDAHKDLEKKRETSQEPAELIKDINTLTEEKKQLESKIEGMKLRNKSYEGFDELLTATRELRHEQEEEQRLQDRIYEQHTSLEQFKARKDDSAMRLKEMKIVEESSSTPQEMLTALQNEVDRFKSNALNQLPNAIKEKTKQLADMTQMAGTPKSENDIRTMQNNIDQYVNDIKDMKDRIEQLRAKKGSSQLEMYKKKVTSLQKEITKKEKELFEEQQEKNSVENEIKSNQEAYQRAQSFQKYREVLVQTTEKYKQLKQELSRLQGETVILNRTYAVLQTRDEKLDEIMDELEKKKGVEGARKLQADIDAASASKSKADEDKGQLLQQLSFQIEQVKNQLDSKKGILGPQINELRVTREEFSSLEAVHKEKNQTYNNTAVGLEAERKNLEGQCDELESQCLKYESMYHQLSTSISILQQQLERAKKEEKYIVGQEVLTPDFHSYKDLYNDRLNRLESLTKTLLKKQKSLKDNEESDKKQKEMFQQLYNLLQLKKTSQAQRKKQLEHENDGVTMGHMNYEGADVMMINQETY